MMGLCHPDTVATHRRFARAVEGTQPRVLAADVLAEPPVTTEVTLRGTEPVRGAVLDAIGLYGLGIDRVASQGDATKLIVR